MSKTTMPTWGELCPRLLAVMRRKGWGFVNLATAAGLKETTVRSSFQRAKDAQWSTVTKMLAALGLSLRWVQQAEAQPPKKGKS